MQEKQRQHMVKYQVNNHSTTWQMFFQKTQENYEKYWILPWSSECSSELLWEELFSLCPEELFSELFSEELLPPVHSQCHP